MRRDRPRRPWHLYLLALAAIAVAVAAAVEIGPPSSSARTAREVVSAADGVVQSTVTASGNIQAGTDVAVNFKTSGTLAHVYVSVGQHVSQGQLLATLDPTAAQLQLDQAQASLTAAEDQLAAAENGTTTGSAAGSTAAAGSASGTSSATTGYTTQPATVEFVADHRVTSGPTTTQPTTTRPTTTRPIATTPQPTRPSSTRSTATGATGSSPTGAGRSGSGAAAAGSSTTTTPSPASIASAQAAVYGAQVSVHNAEIALQNTRLYAPTSGTIVSLANLSPGDAVSAGSTANASASARSSTGSSPASGGSGLAGGASSAGSLANSSLSGGGSSGSGASGSPFAEIVNTGSLSMTVALSEADIDSVKVGQSATVTPDALAGVALAAHVSQIAPVGTSSSGVVSYSTTLTLDQSDPRVKPGMSASASIVTAQAKGVTVPNQAVQMRGSSIGTVEVMADGKVVPRQVIVGLRGNLRTQIVSGLSAGQQVVVTITLPSLSSTATTSTGSNGTLGGGPFGGGGLGGAGGGFFRRVFGGGGFGGRGGG